MTLTRTAIETTFAQVQQHLQEKPWFQSENWLCSVHPFPEVNPDGLTLHLSKPHWFNDQHHGIHIETYLDFDPAKQKKTYLTLHLLHTETIPGTALKRKQLTQPVVDQLEPALRQWPGYVFRVGKYGQQPFSKALDVNQADFPDVLAEEMGRLCQVVGPVVDLVLQEIELPPA